MIDNLFMGKNGLVWWVGRVVSNAGPYGRVRVRIVGWHNEDDAELPDEALPWANVMLPTTNAGIGGVGSSVVGLQPNTRVIGFFLDGMTGQFPIVIGVLSGLTAEAQYGSLETGSTPSQPNPDELIAAVNIGKEDCPDGDSTGTSSINLSLPDPAKVEINRGEWVLPCTGFVSSAYAERSGRHNGVDICPAGFYKQTSAGNARHKGRLMGPTNIPVYAAADGIVIHKWTANVGQKGIETEYDSTGRGSRSFGNAIAIKHNLSTGTFVTIYAHLGENQDPAADIPGAGINVSVGQKVSRGQQIGTIGRTHSGPSLTHLHFEIRVGESLPKNNNHINPGRVFPQLAHRHHAILSWVNNQLNYNVDPIFDLEDAPVKALEGPK